MEFGIHKNKEEYLRFYHLDKHLPIHSHEWITCKNNKIFIQSFTPPITKGTIWLIHGFLDHSNSLHYTINFFIQKGYEVQTIDLIGHGLSSGNRGEIKAFTDYATTFKEVLMNKSTGKENVFAIGHSTGAAMLIDFCIRYHSPFEKVILVCPLIRSYLWTVTSPFMNIIRMNVRRMYRKNTSNESYLTFLKKDPLQVNVIRNNWLLALKYWYNNLQSINKKDNIFHIMQGNKDTTVDWSYNCHYLLQTFPNSNAVLYDEGHHHLLNEKDPLRRIVHEYMQKVIEG